MSAAARSRPGPVDAVLFDLDGTLVHSPIDFPLMRRSVLELAREAGLDAACLDAMQRRDALAIIDEVASRLEAPGAGRFRQAADRALVRIEVQAAERAEEAAGAGRLMSSLQHIGIKVGIVTRNSPEAVGRVLRRIPLPHDILLTRRDTPAVKPDPRHLWQALNLLDSTPGRSVMVGDHPMDVLGGRAAGMWTCVVAIRGEPRDFSGAPPDISIRSLDELLEWISPSSS